MNGLLRASLATALLAFPLLLAGCEIGGLTMVIPDFESSEVLGVRVYRQVDSTGDPDVDYVLASEIVFNEPVLAADGHERMNYTVDGLTNSDTFSTVVTRDAQNPDRVEVDLLFMYELPDGGFRVSTYNAVGESPLSNEELVL